MNGSHGACAAAWMEQWVLRVLWLGHVVLHEAHSALNLDQDGRLSHGVETASERETAEVSVAGRLDRPYVGHT